MERIVCNVAISLGLMFGVAHVFWLLAEVLWAVGALIGLAQLIFVYIRAGQHGPNQYGPDPLEA